MSGARLYDVDVHPPAIPDFLELTRAAAAVELTPDGIRRLLASMPTDIHVSGPELLYQRLAEKSRRPTTLDAAAVGVLDSRRRHSTPRRFEWWLLTLYSWGGYGRQARRPLLIWSGILLAWLGARIARAIAVDGGAVTLHPHSSIDWGRATIQGGDFVATVILAPVELTSRTDNVSLLGVSGGFLLALKVALTVPLLFAATGLRSRVRIRPKGESE